MSDHEPDASAMTPAHDPVTVALTGMMPVVLITAALLAFPVCLALLWLYRRAVVRSMRGGGPEAALPLLSRAPFSEPNALAPLALVEDEMSSTSGTPSCRALLRQARGAPWRLAAVYGLAGLAFATVMSVAYQLTSDGALRPVRSALFTWMFAWPLVLIAHRVATSTRTARLAVTMVYFAVLTVLGSISILLSPAVTPVQLAGLWLMTNVPPTLLLLAFLNRRVRAVGPLVVAFMVAVVLGMQVAISLADEEHRLRRIVEIGDRFGVGAPGILLSLLLAGGAAFALLGWILLSWIRRRYEVGAITDESIEIDANWLIFGFTFAVNLAFEGVWWMLAALVAFAAHKLVTRVGFHLLQRVNLRRSPPTLLVLRVFALGRKSERLFESVQKHWRHLGTVRVIAGPDLATSTVEPHEFLDFVTGRLSRRFIDGPAALEQRLTEAQPHRDRDGRFRVAEFFCRRDTWRVVFNRLATQSDAVLMDLRGFGAQHAGCQFEVQTLVQAVELGKVVFVHDKDTDRAWLEQTVQQAWATRQASARGGDGGATALRLVRYERSGDFPRLLRAACAAAGSALIAIRDPADQILLDLRDATT